MEDLLREGQVQSSEPNRWQTPVGKLLARAVVVGNAGRAVATGGSSRRQTKWMEKRLTPKFRAAPPAVVEPARAFAAEMDPRAGPCFGCLFIALAPRERLKGVAGSNLKASSVHARRCPSSGRRRGCGDCGAVRCDSGRRRSRGGASVSAKVRISRARGPSFLNSLRERASSVLRGCFETLVGWSQTFGWRALQRTCGTDGLSRQEFDWQTAASGPRSSGCSEESLGRRPTLRKSQYGGRYVA